MAVYVILFGCVERPYENVTNEFSSYKKKLCMHEAEMNLLVKNNGPRGTYVAVSYLCNLNCISHLECTLIVEEGPHEHLVTHKVV